MGLSQPAHGYRWHLSLDPLAFELSRSYLSSKLARGMI